jgi:hypothetical protein
MIRPEYEFRECLQCTYIEDCPHPQVDVEGSPVPPNHCTKAESIKLIRRIDEITARDGDA